MVLRPPGPTQPNRLSLVLGGRIPELDNFSADSPAMGFLTLPTIFDLLTQRGIDWVYDEQDVAFLRLFDAYRRRTRAALRGPSTGVRGPVPPPARCPR